MTVVTPALRIRLKTLLEVIYPELDSEPLVEQTIAAFWSDDNRPTPHPREPGISLWSEQDALVICYGDSVNNGEGEEAPLETLRGFLFEHVTETLSSVHILPFFPYTSDDGFAVSDYYSVDPRLGDWTHISAIASRFKLMADLVLNHCSSGGVWFDAYREGKAPYDEYFFESEENADLRAVVRPRTNPLLRPVPTAHGLKHVWCTFGHDQVDLNFKNPSVLLEFLRIMRRYLDAGISILRLDAVAFLWKVPGTPCIHLPQTHAIIKLLRVLCDFNADPVILISETNVPNAENLSYFGNRDEANVIYNFSLPPLITHALLTGNAQALVRWQMAMPPAQLGCAYLNFTASHDGIGVRPAEGLLTEAEIHDMIDAIRGFGGLVSMRDGPDGQPRPYEMNISFFDAMQGTLEGPDAHHLARFLCSQTIVMALEGIPAFYLNALLGTANDLEGYERTQHNRSINRYRWPRARLEDVLADPDSVHHQVFTEVARRIRIRGRQKAFHPNATQFTLQLGEQLFAFWRQSMERDQSIFALHNVSAEPLTLPTVNINLIGGESWVDLFTDEPVDATYGEITFAPYQCRWITNRR